MFICLYVFSGCRTEGRLGEGRDQAILSPFPGDLHSYQCALFMLPGSHETGKGKAPNTSHRARGLGESEG